MFLPLNSCSIGAKENRKHEQMCAKLSKLLESQAFSLDFTHLFDGSVYLHNLILFCRKSGMESPRPQAWHASPPPPSTMTRQFPLGWPLRVGYAFVWCLRNIACCLEERHHNSFTISIFCSFLCCKILLFQMFSFPYKYDQRKLREKIFGTDMFCFM